MVSWAAWKVQLPPGYAQADVAVTTDVDECELGTDDCQDADEGGSCTNTDGGSTHSQIFTDFHRFSQIFRRLVLGWIDSYDSNQMLIFSGLSRSTKLSG